MESNIKTKRWKELKPTKPYHFFVEKDFSSTGKVRQICKAILKYLKSTVSGVKTNRDHFLTDFDKRVLVRRIQTMRDNKLDDDLFNQTYHLKNGDYWNSAREREKVRNNENWRQSIL